MSERAGLMTNASKQDGPTSVPRTLWIIAAILIGVVLVMDLVDWAGTGQPDWRRISLHAGMELLIVGQLVGSKHKLWQTVLPLLALACILASFVIRFRGGV
jgi:hypothetical protein